MAAEEIAMGNVQTIWSAVANEVNRMVENQKVVVGESVSAIEELRRQMMSARADRVTQKGRATPELYSRSGDHLGGRLGEWKVR